MYDDNQKSKVQKEQMLSFDFTRKNIRSHLSTVQRIYRLSWNRFNRWFVGLFRRRCYFIWFFIYGWGSLTISNFSNVFDIFLSDAISIQAWLCSKIIIKIYYSSELTMIRKNTTDTICLQIKKLNKEPSFILNNFNFRRSRIVF